MSDVFLYIRYASRECVLGLAFGVLRFGVLRCVLGLGYMDDM